MRAGGGAGVRSRRPRGGRVARQPSSKQSKSGKIAGSASARRLGNLKKAKITHPLLLKHLPQRLARVVLPL